MNILVFPARVLACGLVLVAAAIRLRADDLALVEAAKAQVGVTTSYDPSYSRLSYPNGDVAADRGVCSDVVIRALRVAHAIDLQSAVHEDMRAAFSAYPRQWKLTKPDRNIDHRRVLNLQVYFARQGWTVAAAPAGKAAVYLPGDIVTCVVPPNLPHVMIVAQERTKSGRPLVIHNIGAGVQVEDCLGRFPITGHYRVPAAR